MIHLKQAVIVEGKYDKIKLSSIIDGLIISTEGFGIFKDKEKCQLIRYLAKTDGVIILTDSDSAGQLIRNHIKGIVKGSKIWHVYIPQILGKERRKTIPAKSGFLGVEGVSSNIIEKALEQAGLDVENTAPKKHITKTDFYIDGLSGGPESSQKRQRLMTLMGIPSYLSCNSLLELLNHTIDKTQYEDIILKLQEEGL